MHKNFILGGGISGLVFKHFNPDFTIIEPSKVGGQLRLHIGDKVRYLFKDQYVKQLLEELNMKHAQKQLKMRYYSRGKFTKTVSSDENHKYVCKKLSIPYVSNGCKIDAKVRNDKNSAYYDVNMDNIVAKLAKGVEIINNRVILIDTIGKTITLGNYKKFAYDNLISTIPAPDFRYLAYNSLINSKLRYSPGTLVTIDELPSSLFDYRKQFDILYYLDNDMPFCRVWKHDDKYLVEIPGCWEKWECEKYFEEMGAKVLKHDIQRVYTIFNEEVPKIPNVTYIGRLAKWQSNYFINDAIKDSIEYGDKNAKK